MLCVNLEPKQMIGELYTLSEWQSQCIDPYLDEATGQDLFNKFLYRRPCTDQVITLKSGETVNLFEQYLKNSLRFYSGRYLQLLRVEQTDFDPMVTQYLERWVMGASTGSESTTGNMTGTSGSHTTSSEHTVTADTTDTGQTGTERTTLDQTVNNNGQSSHNEHTVTDDVTTTDQDSTTHYTDAETIGVTTTEHTVTAVDDKRVHAELPQTTNNYSLGMPSQLNWAYLTNQTENTTDTTQDVTGTSNTQRNLTHNGTATTDTTTNYDGDTTVTGSETHSDLTHTDNTGTKNTTLNTDTVYNGDTTVTGTIDVTGSTGSQTTGTRNTQGATDTKEWYTGRSGVRSPAELLDLARRYIGRSNAFRWLCDRLDDCFYKLYEGPDTYWQEVNDGE